MKRFSSRSGTVERVERPGPTTPSPLRGRGGVGWGQPSAALRAALACAAAWVGWSKAERDEIAEAIKAALDSGDKAAESAWLGWLREVANLDFMAERCREAERRIHADARKAA